jgi:hypothetical protein
LAPGWGAKSTALTYACLSLSRSLPAREWWDAGPTRAIGSDGGARPAADPSRPCGSSIIIKQKKKENLDGLMCYASGACLKALRQRIRPVDRRGIPLGPAHPRDDLCGARPPARSAAAGERPFNKASPRNPGGVPQGRYSGKKRFLRASRCLFRFFPPVISWLCCWRKEKKERLRRVEKAGNGQTEDRRWLRSQTAPRVPLVRPVAGGRCWFVPRGEYCWLVAGGWFVPREKYC